jgi:hypothetical protein
MGQLRQLPLTRNTPAIGVWVASPDLEGGQVADLSFTRPQFATTSAAYSCERDGRITQMS